ncbi:hypothetical protein KKA39_02245 [Patescibacteria group bacterium]|nr:hypothetical protein [Patescibacteria group bacterium]MBU1728105.1 hypothetical protein [Patescibacteria group bacterium]
MRKVFFLLVALAFSLGLECFGQRQPVLPYGNHSPEEIYELCMGTSVKSLEFRKLVVEILRENLKDTLIFSEKNLKWASGYFSSEEMYLEEGQYENSGWNPTGKIEFFPGHKWHGFVIVFRCGSHFAVICKQDCANILRIKKTSNENQIHPNPVTIVHDTVYASEQVVYQNNQDRWSASNGTQNYTYYSNYNDPRVVESYTYAPMGRAYNYGYSNCNPGYGNYNGYGHGGNQSQNYGYGCTNGTAPSASWSQPQNTGYSYDGNNSWGGQPNWNNPPTNYNYCNGSGWLKK